MGDPRQAKMMLFMPFVFTFMFLNLPSGLVLYWTLSNVLQIAPAEVHGSVKGQDRPLTSKRSSRQPRRRCFSPPRAPGESSVGA